MTNKSRYTFFLGSCVKEWNTSSRVIEKSTTAKKAQFWITPFGQCSIPRTVNPTTYITFGISWLLIFHANNFWFYCHFFASLPLFLFFFFFATVSNAIAYPIFVHKTWAQSYLLYELKLWSNRKRKKKMKSLSVVIAFHCCYYFHFSANGLSSIDRIRNGNTRRTKQKSKYGSQK